MPVIIVIDDEQRQRGILKTILEDEGYEVHSAPSAEKGLELISALSPDVVLTDLRWVESRGCSSWRSSPMMQ